MIDYAKLKQAHELAEKLSKQGDCCHVELETEGIYYSILSNDFYITLEIKMVEKELFIKVYECLDLVIEKLKSLLEEYQND